MKKRVLSFDLLKDEEKIILTKSFQKQYVHYLEYSLRFQPDDYWLLHSICRSPNYCCIDFLALGVN